MSFIEPDWPAPAHIVALSTLRDGGTSLEPYASLNLADHVDDDSEAVAVNRAILSQWLPPGTQGRTGCGNQGPVHHGGGAPAAHHRKPGGEGGRCCGDQPDG